MGQQQLTPAYRDLNNHRFIINLFILIYGLPSYDDCCKIEIPNYFFESHFHPLSISIFSWNCTSAKVTATYMHWRKITCPPQPPQQPPPPPLQQKNIYSLCWSQPNPIFPCCCWRLWRRSSLLRMPSASTWEFVWATWGPPIKIFGSTLALRPRERRCRTVFRTPVLIQILLIACILWLMFRIYWRAYVIAC